MIKLQRGMKYTVLFSNGQGTTIIPQNYYSYELCRRDIAMLIAECGEITKIQKTPIAF